MSRSEQPRIRAYARVATREQLTGLESVENGKAYVYARVGGGSSPLPGAEFDQATLKAQVDRLSECAESMGLMVVEDDAEFARLGISESSMEKMLKAAMSGEIQAVMVTSCSRLHRDSEKAIDMLAELDHYGVRIYSQQEGWMVPNRERSLSRLHIITLLI